MLEIAQWTHHWFLIEVCYISSSLAQHCQTLGLHSTWPPAQGRPARSGPAGAPPEGFYVT